MIDLKTLKQQVNSFARETERLIIRRARPSDRDELTAHEHNPDIMRYIHDIPDPERIRKRVQSVIDPWGGEENEWSALVVCRQEDDQVLGIVALRVTSIEHATVEIGYRLHPNHHGRGYAFEAVRSLCRYLMDDVQVHKLVAFCTSVNEPSYRLMEKLGMQREGCLRQHSRLNGEWYDELVYGLLASERDRLM